MFSQNFLINNIKGKINISCGFGNNESYAFAQKIEQLLIRSGWQTSDVLMKIYKDNIYGILLVIKSESTAPPYAGVLQEAFNKIGMPVSCQENSKYDEHRLDLIIGLKPSE
jgi:galactitol-specific phosphotransferase system IIB component